MGIAFPHCQRSRSSAIDQFLRIGPGHFALLPEKSGLIVSKSRLVGALAEILQCRSANAFFIAQKLDSIFSLPYCNLCHLVDETFSMVLLFHRYLAQAPAPTSTHAFLISGNILEGLQQLDNSCDTSCP